MRRWVLVSGCVVASCGGAQPTAPAAPPSTVEVPKAKSAPETEASRAAPEAARAGGSSDCVDALRRAADVPAEGEERAVYVRARAAEERGDLPEARKQYFELVSKYPRSRLLPLAYLAFGELFAREALSDPSKLDLATASYTEVVKYPPPDNAAYAYAMLRLGDTRRERDDAQALSSYKKAFEALQQFPSLPCAAELRQGAGDGLVDVYARVGQPARAWVFLQASAGDERARTLFTDLCARYEKAGRAADACAAARAAGADATAAELARKYCP